MNKNVYARRQPGAAPASAKNNEEAPTLSQEISDLIGKVKALLHERQAEKALKAIAHSRLKSPWVNNATGVCLLQIGEAAQAARIFHNLAANSGVLLNPDAPVVFKTNYAAALLACNNMAGCLNVLHEIQDEENPAVRQLRDAIEQWKRSLSLWRRLCWLLGDYPKRQTAWDLPVGGLE